jgi:PadR family transcriptional regulator PadR
MGPNLRMTIPTQLVLRELLMDPTRELYGLEVGRSAGLASGTVYPILARLEAVGWVTSRWEDVDPRAANRPARRYYRLTDAGAEAAPSSLARAARSLARARPLPLPGQA